MKHLNHARAALWRLFDRARVVAVVGASPRADRHSHFVFRYLRAQGLDVIPVRPDGAEVDGQRAVAKLDDIPGEVDLVVVFRRADAVPELLAEAARAHPEAVWLQPGTESREAAEEAKRLGLPLVVGRCVEREHHGWTESAGSPAPVT